MNITLIIVLSVIITTTTVFNTSIYDKINIFSLGLISNLSSILIRESLKGTTWKVCAEDPHIGEGVAPRESLSVNAHTNEIITWFK
jgi:hypothetical protein